MEAFSLALLDGNRTPVDPLHRSLVLWMCCVFCDININKLLNKVGMPTICNHVLLLQGIKVPSFYVCSVYSSLSFEHSLCPQHDLCFRWCRVSTNVAAHVRIKKHCVRSFVGDASNVIWFFENKLHSLLQYDATVMMIQPLSPRAVWIRYADHHLNKNL